MHSDDRKSRGLTFTRNVAAFADLLKREEQEAASLYEEILSGPPAWWAQRLRTSARARTTSMVQHLLAQSQAQMERSSEYAQELTSMAMELAEAIDPALYPRVHLDVVKAQALRHHAHVLSFRGLFAEALQFAECADEQLGTRTWTAYERARLQLVQASIFHGVGRTEEAVVLTQEAAATFMRFGDLWCYTEARIREGAVLYAAGAVDRALGIWGSVESDPALDLAGRVRLQRNIALCLAELGQHAAAIPYLYCCAMQFELLGLPTECVRSRGALGRSLVAAGRLPEAIPVLKRTTEEYESLGMTMDAALAALEHVEALFAANETADVTAVCLKAIAYLTRAGAAAYATNALASLREASALPLTARTLVRDAYASLRTLSAKRPSTAIGASGPAGSWTVRG